MQGSFCFSSRLCASDLRIRAGVQVENRSRFRFGALCLHSNVADRRFKNKISSQPRGPITCANAQTLVAQCLRHQATPGTSHTYAQLTVQEVFVLQFRHLHKPTLMIVIAIKFTKDLDDVCRLLPTQGRHECIARQPIVISQSRMARFEALIRGSRVTLAANKFCCKIRVLQQLPGDCLFVWGKKIVGGLPANACACRLLTQALLVFYSNGHLSQTNAHGQNTRCAPCSTDELVRAFIANLAPAIEPPTTGLQK